jgi:cellulose synthase/poly-beta-1,6-N-acetylglucosamine synthase-like glycosyltransferase
VNLDTLGFLLVGIPASLFGYALVGYPALLRVLPRKGADPAAWHDPAVWPKVTILVPAYNEEASIQGTLESLLALDYPADRREIIVMSDASTDRTDEIVHRFAGKGVRLVRMSERRGKTAAENYTVPLATGDILVNTDATIRILPGSLKPLIRVFQDPTVGAASGRDMSVGSLDGEGNASEAGYVGYEMQVRSLETRLGGIIGASGCFYAIRRELVDASFPEALSRDFAAPLRARQFGYRTVSVDDAVCIVPRTRSLRSEYHRKVRTMLRGLNTLWYKRQLLDPTRYGRFALMLWSHKVARWLGFLTLPLAGIGILLLAQGHAWAVAVALGAALVLLGGWAAIRWPTHVPMPRLLTSIGYALGAAAAGFVAWMRFFRGTHLATWEPTRRAGVVEAGPQREAVAS